MRDIENDELDPARAGPAPDREAGTTPMPSSEPEEVRRFETVDVRPVRARLLLQVDEFNLQIEGAPTVELSEEAYFESDDWRLNRAGYTLRFSLRDGEGEAVLTPGEGGEPLAATLEMARPASLVESLLAGENAVSWRVRALLGRRALKQRFLLRIRSETFRFRQGFRFAGRIRLVETSVPVAEGEPVRFFRVEIAARKTTPEDFLFLVRNLRLMCGLRSVSISDYEAGLLAVGLVPPGPPSFGPTTVDPGQSVGELAFAVFRKQFARCLLHEPGTRIGVDIEELHDMRVAARRLRSAVGTFRRHVPGGEAFLVELRWLGNVLGEVRDLDVRIEQLAEWRRSFDDAERAAFEPVELELHEQRERARVRLLSELDSDRYDGLVARLTAFLERGSEDEAGRLPAALAAPKLIEGRFRKVMKHGASLTPSSEPERFHRLRIRCKQLRYVFEFHAPLYGSASRKIIARLVELQDLLGRHQDADTSIHWIRAFVREGPPLPPAALFLLGRLAERYTAEARALRRSFPRTLRKLRGKPWKRFREAMQGATGIVPSPSPPAFREAPPATRPRQSPPPPDPPRSIF